MSARRSGIAVVLAAGSACAFGQALHDPTAPPSGQIGEPGAPQAAASGAVLQSVIVSNGRSVALIDGRNYQTGDKIGDATVVAIAGDEVVLRNASGERVLKLHPHLGKVVEGAKAPPVDGRKAKP